MGNASPAFKHPHMNKAFLFANLLIFTLLSCKQDPKNAGQSNLPAHLQPGEKANPMVLAGNWIALDFCARANQYGSVLQTMNNSHVPYAYAINFNPAKPDSALCYNATKFWMMKIQYNEDTLQLLGDPSGKPIYLIYHSNIEKDITMFDPTGPKLKMDRFIKSKAEAPEAYTAFTTALNHNILNGTFTAFGNTKGTNGPVRFNTNGFMEGFKDFDRYVICTGGDCMVAGQEIDVITFYSPKTDLKPNPFGFRYNGQNDTLTLYNLINATPDVQGSYKVGAPAYKFSRKVSQ